MAGSVRGKTASVNHREQLKHGKLKAENAAVPGAK
jgi:hypothetical protein